MLADPKCPECGSNCLYRDGIRYTQHGEIQRYLCKECGFRFSDTTSKSYKECQTNNNHQLGAILQEAKKLENAIEKTKIAGENEGKPQQNFNGELLQFMVKLHNEGIKPNSAKIYEYVLMNLVSHGANLLDPESVKEAIANKNWDDKTKALGVSAYSKYLQVFHGTWIPPKYKPERTVPFIPTMQELDSLISAAHKKLAAYLMLLKQTGMRAGEAFRLKWEDIDTERNMITLNKTEKHGTPRTFQVSPTLISMLQSLPKQNNNVFQGSLINFAKTYRRFRARTANKLENPRLNKITFHTFRHFYATLEYCKTKDILHVKERLGHKNITTTEIYTHLLNDGDSENYYCTVAKTQNEKMELISQGWQFICQDTTDGLMYFRKRKGVL